MALGTLHNFFIVEKVLHIYTCLNLENSFQLSQQMALYIQVHIVSIIFLQKYLLDKQYHIALTISDSALRLS